MTWRTWLKENRGDADFLCLDPADPAQGVLGRITLWRGSKVAATRFFGGLDPQRSPHTLLTALHVALPVASENLVVQLYPYRAAPLLRQVAHQVAESLRPDRIFVASGTPIEDGWPITPADVDLEPDMPFEAKMAQRKAMWIQLFERSKPHEIDLRSVAIDGVRLGSGRAMPYEERLKSRLENALHAEKIGNVLFGVVERDPDESDVAEILHLTACSRATFVHSEAYQGLFCSFARQSGEDFGYGVIQRIDWREMRAHILADAIPPAPVRTLRVGGIKIGPGGDEWGEIAPWQV